MTYTPILQERFPTRETLIIRNKIIQCIRNFLSYAGFLEVETPLLVPNVIPESYLEHFSTTILDRFRNSKEGFLTSSPEAFLKKLLVSGIGNCFEITRSFRNGESHSRTHQVEFTILEWYRINATYQTIMQDCEKLFQSIYDVCFSDKSTRILTYNGKTVNLDPPWIRIKVADAFEKYAGISFDEITNKHAKFLSEQFDPKLIAPIAKKKGYQVEPNHTWEELFNQIFLNEVEGSIARLNKPVILYDYPRPMAALATTDSSDNRFAHRFEIYAGGLELGDCYNELTEPEEQRKRFIRELNEIKRLKKTMVIMDEEFLDALEKGMPAASGIAVGVDRLVMLFTDNHDIRNVRITA